MLHACNRFMGLILVRPKRNSCTSVTRSDNAPHNVHPSKYLIILFYIDAIQRMIEIHAMKSKAKRIGKYFPYFNSMKSLSLIII